MCGNVFGKQEGPELGGIDIVETSFDVKEHSGDGPPRATIYTVLEGRLKYQSTISTLTLLSHSNESHDLMTQVTLRAQPIS